MYYPLQKKHIDSSAFFKLTYCPAQNSRALVRNSGHPLWWLPTPQAEHTRPTCASGCHSVISWLYKPLKCKRKHLLIPSELPHILCSKNTPEDNTTGLVKIPVWQRGEWSVLLRNDYWFVFTPGGLFPAAFNCETGYGNVDMGKNFYGFLLVCFSRITVNTTHNYY